MRKLRALGRAAALYVEQAGFPDYLSLATLRISQGASIAALASELLPDESAASAVRFLQHAVAWFATLGVQVEAVMKPLR